MKGLPLLLRPRALSMKNALLKGGKRGRRRSALMALMGLLLCGGIFVLSTRVLLHFQSISGLGDLLGRLLLSMILLTFFSLLIFSNIISALSNLYLSRDMELIHASPTMIEDLFAARAILTVIDSSWMLAIFGGPVFLAYAYVYRSGVLYFVTLAHLSFALVIIAAGVGIILTMILVKVFPAQRARDLVAVLAIVMGIGVYLLFRFMRPERLVNPDSFFTMAHYLSAVGAPRSPYLPTQWVADSLWACLAGVKDKSFLHEALLTWSTAGAVSALSLWTARLLYFDGFSKSQEAKRRRAGAGALLSMAAQAAAIIFGRRAGAVAAKEMRIFFRDNTQWSQLLLLGALVAVYLYNFSVLPLDMSPIRIDFFQNQICFLNLALAGFVLSAVSARFVFPAISSEGEAFWIVSSSPIKPRHFLWAKCCAYLIPLMLLGEVLIVATNILMDATPLMRILTATSMVLLVLGITAMGVGLGAIYPDFRHHNIAQVATGFGGMTYMILSASFVALTVVLEAGPIYILFMAEAKGIPLTPLQSIFIAASFLAVLLLTALAVYLPMRMGEKALIHQP
jgi:ABC-2 type transport system permease protein